jgi:hypothetical protein
MKKRKPKYKLTIYDKQAIKVLKKFISYAQKGRLVLESYSSQGDVSTTTTTHVRYPEIIYHGTRVKLEMYVK